MVNVTRSEIDRIRASVSDESVTHEENKRRALKEKSDARIAAWPNTLAAQRKAKLDWKKAREEKEESERRQIDQEEAELQRAIRVDAIKRANRLMYEQTDKMKFLRGQQLYTDVIADREDQIDIARKKKEAAVALERKWHEDMMARLAESERRESEEAARRKAKHKDISEIQQKQLEDTKNKLVHQLTTAFVEGQLIKQMAIDDLVEEQRIAAEKQAEAKKQNAEMLKANTNLKDLRKELLKVEQIEADKRKKEVEHMEARVKGRHDLEKKHFEERQKIRMQLIEVATRDLESRKHKEDTILDKHKAESEQKHLEEMERRRLRKEKADEAIELSRRMQIRLKEERKVADKQGAQILAECWKKRNAELEEEQSREAEDRFNKNLEIRRSQEAQVLENRRIAAELKANEILRDEQTKAVMLEDDDRFRDFAQIEIERFRAKGKKTFLLERARDAKDIQLLAGKHK